MSRSKSTQHAAPAAAGVLAAGGAIAAGKLVRDRLSRRERRRERAYRLHPGEDAAPGVRRIARGQLDAAQERLDAAAGDDHATAIHDVRKTLKRLRALLRLSRDELGAARYRSENAALRDAGRRLSSTRDAAVLVATLDDLVERHRERLPDRAFAGLRRALIADAERARHDTAAPAVTTDVREAITAARERTADWSLSEGRDPGVLTRGFERIYRRGRRALAAADDRAGTEQLHDLRKRAKDLWYAARILRPLAPEQMETLARRAHRLSDVLGADHDLAVLADAAERRPAACASGELELLEELVRRRRKRLQRRALKRGRRLYAPKPQRASRPLRRAAAAGA